MSAIAWAILIYAMLTYPTVQMSGVASFIAILAFTMAFIQTAKDIKELFK